MKSNLYKLSEIAFALAIAVVSAYGIASAVNAEQVSAVDGSFGASVSTSPSPVKTPLRATIKAKIDTRLEANGDARNNLLEKRQEIRKEATSTIKAARMEAREEIKDMHASSSAMFKKEMRQELKAKMEAKTFAIRKEALVNELNHSLTNITNISTRINDRIVKAEANGKVVTDAKALFATASLKLAKAKADVAAFQALTVTASSTTGVDLSKPRVVGDAAIKSVKEARDAFQKVVVALAHSLGEKLPTPSITPIPSVSVSATSTATTTTH